MFSISLVGAAVAYVLFGMGDVGVRTDGGRPVGQQTEDGFVVAALQKIEKKVITPVPLRRDGDTSTDDAAALTVSGIIRETNEEQEHRGLVSLREVVALNALAETKARDMFRRGYFEHVSPTGENIGDLAVGRYEYVAIGENLALGNYRDDRDVVGAWMNSPGHRANILHAAFTEIGVAARYGVFEGKSTWISVQVFAKPLSACDEPSDALKNSISAEEAELAVLRKVADWQKAALVAMHPETKGEYEEYNRLVDTYNSVVRDVNDAVARIRVRIAHYNEQVGIFNECATDKE
ncbi:MAG: hypothetical protein A3B29_04465 [Candidatus Sungbacteria bacterium RIFCSPLOWO2_01_FULL_51_34]|nr:MAG: hypothetical protein A3B29_04465 [Candidatus Sungbacteria bacterium RIFCSPLOWO2_01_FULL_51_34]